MADKKYRKWNDSLIITIYEMVKEGKSMQSAADELGVTIKTLKQWVRDKPILKDAIKQARERRVKSRVDSGHSRAETLADYVYKRLPVDLQKLWDQLCGFELDDNPIQRIEQLFADKSTHIRQHLFVHALVVSNFNISEACRKLNITKRLFEQWSTGDLEFASLIDEILFHKKNFFESALTQLVAAGDTAATIFVAKTQLRDRGYDPKVQIEISGTLGRTLDLDSLNVPIEIKRQLLSAAREQMQIAQKNAEGNVIDAQFETAEAGEDEA